MSVNEQAVQAAQNAYRSHPGDSTESHRAALTAALPFLTGVKVGQENYAAFALEICRVAFDGNDLSGDQIQEIGIAHGVLRLEKYDEEEHKTIAHSELFSPGDDVYIFVDPAMAPSPRAQALEELPCDVQLPEVTFKRGVKFSVLLNALKRRESWPENDRALSSQPVADAPFQDRVKPWMLACFGEEISNDKLERCDRFIEEALELVQAIGYSTERAHALVDYVFNRDIGEPHQEVGGVMVTLAALCLASGLDMNKAAEDELARIWTKVEKIRAKQAAKPTGSALPISLPASPGASE